MRACRRNRRYTHLTSSASADRERDTPAMGTEEEADVDADADADAGVDGAAVAFPDCCAYVTAFECMFRLCGIVAGEWGTSGSGSGREEVRMRLAMPMRPILMLAPLAFIALFITVYSAGMCVGCSFVCPRLASPRLDR